MEKKRNGALCFWAFIFCMVLVIHYARLIRPGSPAKFPLFFYRGEIAIDFFFLLAGVLLAKRINTQTDLPAFEWKELWSVIKRVIKRWLPALVIVWTVSFVTINIVFYNDIKTLVNNFFASLLELFPIRNAGFFLKPLTNKGIVGSRIMDQAWVFSAIVIALVILYPLYRKNKVRFETYIAPVLALLLIGYVFFRDNNLISDKWRVLDARYFFYTFKSTFKAVGEMCLGVVCYTLGNRIAQKDRSKKVSVLLAAGEIGCYLAVIVYMQFYKYFPRYSDLLALLLLAGGVMLSHSKAGALSRLYDNRFFEFLGRFSLYPFLTFVLYTKLMQKWMPTAGTLRLEVIYFGLTIVSALVLMALEKPFVKLLKAAKKLFVKPPAATEKETA